MNCESLVPNGQTPFMNLTRGTRQGIEYFKKDLETLEMPNYWLMSTINATLIVSNTYGFGVCSQGSHKC